ncbi:MAG: hypothetical protein HYR74_10380 [Candidatus Eisenbacteria bacterium]|nr:hypothetical protein [Candidatus Eisenbacteria bacterium]
MAPEPWSGRIARVLALVFVAALAAAPHAHALRIVDYNCTNYPSVNFPARQPYFRTIFAPLNADIVVGQEFISQAGVDSFRTNVLNVNEPGQWASAPWFNGNDTDNALFYKPSKVQVLGAWAFYPDPTTNLRYVTVWRLKPLGYSSDGAEFRIYSQHLKASQGSACTGLPCETRRLNECIGIRDSMNAMPAGTHAIVLGDWNFYKSSTEPGYWKVQESQTNNIGRVYDPLNPSAVTQDWHDNPSFATIFTQCPCVTCPSGSGFSGGGLDDRFDQILPTLNFGGTQGLAVIPGTYIVVGEDGQHWNKNITDAPTIPEGATYATALWNASDHLPSRVDIQVPAKISVQASLAFGTVIVGASATQNLPISDIATAPADALTYSMAAPAGFTAPSGTFDLSTAASPGSQPIGMDTSMPAVRSGNLTIASDDLDLPSVAVGLGGTVLDHAQASLDSLAALTAETLDFGSHDAGGFSTLMARISDRDYQSLRARLSVTQGVFAGGDGRFSIVGGFAPALVADVAQTYTVQFDDTNATPDTDYDGTLTFSSADETLPGAAAQPDLVVSLHAKATSSVVGVPIRRLPTVTRLYPPAPNPVGDRTLIKLDLARAARVDLAIYDLAGRRVTTVAAGDQPAGAYQFPWDGRTDQGAPLGSGLYFARLMLDGALFHTARIAILR